MDMEIGTKVDINQKNTSILSFLIVNIHFWKFFLDKKKGGRYMK